VVVVANGDRAAADAVADEVADLGWSLRAEFQAKDSVTPAEAVEQAAASSELSVVSDTGDSVGGGSGGDSTTLLEAFLAHGGPRALIPMVHPPIAGMVGELSVGESLTIEVGGAVTGWWKPVTVTGVVRAVESDYTAPDSAGVRHVTLANPLPFQNSRYCGPTVALEVDNVMLVVSARSGPAGSAPIHYTGLGIDVDAYDAAVLKTASNFQFWTEDLSTNLIRVNTPGPTQSDVVDLPWSRIPRPMYPLDPDLTAWR
jgi:microcystin degradation protein MlrC